MSKAVLKGGIVGCGVITQVAHMPAWRPTCSICCDLAFAFRLEFFYYAGFLLQEKSKGLFSRRGSKNG